MSNRRMGDGGGSMDGATYRMREAVSAKVELLRLGRLKHLSHGHVQSVRRHVQDGTANLEFRHVLVDYSDGNKQLKARMMTRRQAYDRNQSIRGTGFAWAMCGK